MSVTRHAILTLIFALGPLPALLTGCWSWKPQWRLERRIQDALEPYTDRLAATYVHDPNNPLSGEDIFGASFPVTLEGGYEVHEHEDYNLTYRIKRDHRTVMNLRFMEISAGHSPQTLQEYYVRADMYIYSWDDYQAAAAVNIMPQRADHLDCGWSSQSNTWTCRGHLGLYSTISFRPM